jgi:hypothetical protein
MKDTFDFMGTPMQADKQNKKEQYRGIAEVGSIDFQRKWCVNGTAEEYVLLNELIETTIYSARHKATHPVLSKDFSESERAVLLDFHDRVDELFDDIPWNDPTASIEEIVENSEAMKKIRQAANDCLRQVQASFSVEELLAD